MWFLIAFAKLRKATISFVLFVRLSARPQSATRLPLVDFYDIWYMSIFRKYVEKIQVLLKSEKIKATLY